MTQVEDLKNIIAFENVNILNSYKQTDPENHKHQKYEQLGELLSHVQQRPRDKIDIHKHDPAKLEGQAR